MPAGVNASIRLAIAASLTGAGDLGAPRLKLDDILETLELTPGTDALGKADLLFADTRTLAASATEDLDLAGLLTDAFGATITAAEIVLFYVKAAAANTNNVRVSPAAVNGFLGPFVALGDGVAVKPGEYQLFVSRTGWPVTAGTADLLSVTNGGAGTSVDYDVVVIGRTVAA